MGKRSKVKSNKLSIIITVILIVLIVFVLVFCHIFGKAGQAPSIFGYNIHIMNGKAMGEYIPDKSAVVSKMGVLPKVKEVGLCRLDDSKTVTVLLLAAVEERDGENVYLFKTTTSEDYEVVALKESNIIGTAQWISIPIGRIISFAVSKVGIIILLIIPATIILISLLVSLAKGLSSSRTEKASSTEDEEEIEEDEYIKNAAISFRDEDAVPEVSKESEFVASDIVSDDKPDVKETPPEDSFIAPPQSIDEVRKETQELKKDLSLTEQILLDYTPEQTKKAKPKHSYIEALMNSQDLNPRRQDNTKVTPNASQESQPYTPKPYAPEPRKEPQMTTQTMGSHHVSLNDNGMAQYNRVTPTADMSELEKTLPHIPEGPSEKTTSSIDALLKSVGQQTSSNSIPAATGNIEDYDITPKPKNRQTSTNKALEEMMRLLERGKK